MMFFETVSRMNASRANNGKAPMSYNQQIEIIRDILIKSGVSPEIPLAVIPRISSGAGSSGFQVTAHSSGQQGASSSNYQGNSASQRGGRGGSNKSSGRKPATYNNQHVCYSYNNTEGRICQNTSSGCTDGKKSYAHVCNVWLEDKKTFCLLEHPRKNHN